MLVGVALRAGIGTAECLRQIGARHADAVIAARVDHHVVLLRHVAFNALRARGARFVEMVLRGVELRGVVAAHAQRVA